MLDVKLSGLTEQQGREARYRIGARGRVDVTRRRGLELRIRGDVTLWLCWRRKNNVWPLVVGSLICVIF